MRPSFLFSFALETQSSGVCIARMLFVILSVPPFVGVGLGVGGGWVVGGGLGFVWGWFMVGICGYRVVGLGLV